MSVSEKSTEGMVIVSRMIAEAEACCIFHVGNAGRHNNIIMISILN